MSTKLPVWPTLHNTFAAELADAEIAYWEARCRLLYAAMESYKGRESYKIFNDGINDSKTGLWADQALQDCGPLPEGQP